MADLELKLAQFSFLSAIRGHHVYLATHLRMRIATVHMNIIKCGYCSRAATITLTRVLCGAYSRVAFIRGAAFIQGNTVLLI